MPPNWKRNLPNALTCMRLVLAAAFFFALDFYWHGRSTVLPANIAVALFVVAAITDALDGWLARKWDVISLFGRVMDPLCDKVLVLGAFVYLAGPRFLDPDLVAQGSRFAMSTGIYTWMVVVIIFRELLVTGIRGVAEATGISFPSNWWGKWKMILQAIIVPIVIVFAANIDLETQLWAAWTRDILVWTMLIVTVTSGIPYLTQFIRGLRERKAQREGGERE